MPTMSNGNVKLLKLNEVIITCRVLIFYRKYAIYIIMIRAR